ncbi:MAG TPA: hypothetical protein IAB27_03745 [Candidatus Coprosoma intestinipullorum]|uniref:Uncharacterized protein n=1 Tax=Candidatus Coprosoma intestinipullorum TaxID=2840752 RepID=A0A9D1CY74_9FIRM|nr:hypothetical protein [Candidatus Coprosoma intestinipullorum]
MTFKDLEKWEQEGIIDSLKPRETPYVEYTKDDIIAGLKKENQELKKQLNEKIALEIKLKEELEDKRKEYQEVYKDVREEIKDYKNQQKEFIEWLENYIEEVDNNRKFHKMYSASEERLSSKYHTLQAVLSKYKEITGSDNK